MLILYKFMLAHYNVQCREWLVAFYAEFHPYTKLQLPADKVYTSCIKSTHFLFG